ncbi:hypothetical protein Q4489_08635 [Thalassotalea sp. 1_MG-2023]|uniref:hypothetical protein n=1 Tax=Thalassotalea sp. 1_MG-2023 TaxID=3062680 RepID=UPI0026E2CFBB|nr:hypothetical protein [Thalassotalea sp. 1_MG-2023]MDO6427075.1 hypothetical protein [Thalassotalea sp. 1_MG-2023]
MKLPVVIALITNGLLTACSSNPETCEDITLATEQIQECKTLQGKIDAAKDKPIIRTELERRYQQNCVDMRYYRDSQQDAICGNKEEMQALEEKGVNN